MAHEELDDLGFLLPSELLADDDDPSKTTSFDVFSGGYNNGDPLAFTSDLSSPGTESDDDDFLTDLTRRVSRSTLLDSAYAPPKGWNLSTSPESTLCGFKTGPNAGVGWDLVYKSAEEVARLRLAEETAAFYSSKQLSLPPPNEQKPVTVAQPNPTPGSGFYPQTQTHHSYQQLQAAKMKQEQAMRDRALDQGMMEYHRQNERRNGSMGSGQGLSMSAWPTLQQSQQIAVFLGENGAKKERVGTGVFMPRRVEPNTTQTRKKQGCPTVVLPDRVVQALNRNIDSINAHIQQRANGTLTTEHDARFWQRNHVMVSQPVMNQELRLPQEWSY